MKKRVWWLLLLLAALLLATAGSSLAAEKKIRIGVAAIGLEHTWDIKAFNGAMDRIKELGGEAIGLDGERKTQKHIDNLETLLQMKPDAIIIVLGYKDIMDPVLEKITRAGIPIVTADFPTQYSLCNVSSSNEVMGRMIAEKMAQDLGYKGNIVSFYRPGSPIAETRRRMLQEVLDKYPGLKIVAEQPYVIPGTVPHAMSVMENLLIANPKKGQIDAVWSLFDQPVIGAAMAIEAAGRAGEIKLYGIDGDPKALELIKKGTYTATVLQQPYKIGQLAAEQAMKLARGEKVPKQIYVDVQLVTKENVDQFLSQK
ncbi:MAG: substrate-binding domain-containing protein [Bacillota bacterium]|nr:substrate-binding domain-containing protein [Bacillota bacterium]